MGVISNGTTLLDGGSLDSGVASGALVLIKTLTASNSGDLSFVNGSSNVVFDGTYKEYIFKFSDIHPSADNIDGLTFQGSTDGGSSYNTTITSTYFRTSSDESGSSADLQYQASQDQPQGTGYQNISQSIGTDNDQSGAGILHVFDPASTTFVKHFMARSNNAHQSDKTRDVYAAGFFNTTSAINAIQFKTSSGNIDAGTIKMYGVK